MLQPNGRELNLLSLHNDCLEQIMEHLPMESQLAVADVCQRFRDVMQSIWRIRYRNTTLRTDSPELLDVPIDMVQNFFTYVSVDIERLVIKESIGDESSSLLNFLLSLDFPRIKVLYCHSHSLTDDQVQILAERCPQLEVLYLSSFKVSGAFINTMKKLKELHVSCCSLTKDNLRNIVSQLEHLKVLDVKKRPRLLHNIRNRSLLCNILDGLNLCNLSELIIGEDDMTMSLVEHLYTCTQLRTLHVHPLSYYTEVSTAWSIFVQLFGSRIRTATFCGVIERNWIMNAISPNKFDKLEEVTILCTFLKRYYSFLKVPTVKTLIIDNHLFLPNLTNILKSSPHINTYQIEQPWYSVRLFYEMITDIINIIGHLRRREIRSTDKVLLYVQESGNNKHLMKMQSILNSNMYTDQNVLNVDFISKEKNDILHDYLMPYMKFIFHDPVKNGAP